MSNEIEVGDSVLVLDEWPSPGVNHKRAHPVEGVVQSIASGPVGPLFRVEYAIGVLPEPHREQWVPRSSLRPAARGDGRTTRRQMSLARELWWDALGGAPVTEYGSFDAGWAACRRSVNKEEQPDG